MQSKIKSKSLIFLHWCEFVFFSFGHKSFLPAGLIQGDSRPCAFRLEVAITHTAEICHCWLPEPSSLWFALFKPCLSNLPPELLTELCSEALEITLFISLSSSDLQCRAFWCRNKAEKNPDSFSPACVKSYKEGNWTCSLKNHGVRLWFLDPAESYLCVWACFISVFV